MTPLRGIRVLELVDGLGESCGRYLADLGAEVIKVEPQRGARSRAAGPVVDGVSLPFALRNANKLGVTEGRLPALLASADLVLAPYPPGDDGDTAQVWVTVTPFGKDGAYRDWAATAPVLYALSGALSRSGTPGERPLLPPEELVEETVGVHAAWSALLAYYQFLRTGTAQTVDLSAFEVMVHGFDPGFGTQGSAAAGRSEDYPRGRPDAGNFYPVFPCRDGFVRICLLAKRQWRGMFAWLGEPAEFADPKYDTIPARFAAADRLYPLLGELFATLTRDEAVAEGARRGVPVGGVLDGEEVLETEHFSASGALIDAEVAPGVHARIPSGYLRGDGKRYGFRQRAPEPGEHDAVVEPRERDVAERGSSAGPPLRGLRVLDLGVIVFGAELSRQFADNGADVLKIENADFPDGLRQSKRGSAMSPSVAWGHRNKRSMGLDLRSAGGKELFLRLAADADVVLANFKPGTLESMGLSYAELAAVNPRIVVSESSAFGGTGPWRTRLGYGPLVRASCGVSELWRYPDDPATLCDAVTVYPDHVAAQVSAVGVLAALIERRGSATGRHLELAQSDVALVQLGPRLAAASRRAGSAAPTGTAVHQCAGDDEWCVVSVRDDADRQRLRGVLGAGPELLAEWASQRDPVEVMRLLQAAGVPAGAMLRLPDLLTDPHLRARRAFRTLEHRLLPGPLPAAGHVGRFAGVPEPPILPAPLAGEQTREICGALLDMDEPSVDALVDAGVLQPESSKEDRAVRGHTARGAV